MGPGAVQAGSAKEIGIRDGRRDQTPAAAHMRERLLCLVVVSDFLEVRITVVPSVKRVQVWPPEGGREAGQRMRSRCRYVIMAGNV
jgi:hypothetical protein